VNLDFTLCVGGVQFIDWVAPPRELADLLAEVDTVAYLRVLTNDDRAGDCEADAAKLTAKVLNVMKPDRVENKTLTFWQELRYEEPARYPVGTELYVFLKKWRDRYVRAYGSVVSHRQLQV
jgi:hypothetical protein